MIWDCRRDPEDKIIDLRIKHYNRPTTTDVSINGKIHN